MPPPICTLGVMNPYGSEGPAAAQPPEDAAEPVGQNPDAMDDDAAQALAMVFGQDDQEQPSDDGDDDFMDDDDDEIEDYVSEAWNEFWSKYL